MDYLILLGRNINALNSLMHNLGLILIRGTPVIQNKCAIGKKLRQWRSINQKGSHPNQYLVPGTKKLMTDPCDYPFSTAKFYMLGVKEFNFIKDLREEFFLILLIPLPRNALALSPLAPIPPA